MLLYEPESWD